MYYLHNEQGISTSIHRRQVSSFPMEVRVAFAADHLRTYNYGTSRDSCYRPQRRGLFSSAPTNRPT